MSVDILCEILVLSMQVLSLGQSRAVAWGGVTGFLL